MEFIFLISYLYDVKDSNINLKIWCVNEWLLIVIEIVNNKLGFFFNFENWNVCDFMTTKIIGIRISSFHILQVSLISSEYWHKVTNVIYLIWRESDFFFGFVFKFFTDTAHHSEQKNCSTTQILWLNLKN